MRPILSLVFVLSGCIGDLPNRECTGTGDCLQDGVTGQCIVSTASSGKKWCVFPAGSCSSGEKWGVLSGDGLADMCVISSSTGPIVTISSPSARANATPQIVFNTETGATYTCHFDDGAPFTCTSGIMPPSALSQGDHVIYVSGTDGSGKTGPEASKSFTVDTTLPTFATFDGPVDDSVVLAGAYTFTFAATDNSGTAPTLTCLLDGAAPSSGCSSPARFSGLAFGPHTFSVSATDDVGNVQTASRRWTVSPVVTGQAATMVIGQPDLMSTIPLTEQRNAHQLVPGGLTWDGHRLWATDSARVLGWEPIPTSPDSDAIYVLGQASLTTYMQPTGPTQTSFSEAVGVSGTPSMVALTDSPNNRVLVFTTGQGVTNGMGATLVLGQPDFIHADSGSMGNQLSRPLHVWTDGNRMLVADANNYRVLLWNSLPTQNGARADVALGATSVDAVGSPTDVSATTVNFPLGVFSDGQKIFVLDGQASRVLIWNSFPRTSGVPADVVVGQPGFNTKGLGTDSKSFGDPVDGVVVGNCLFVVDLGNSRVLVWAPVPTTNGAAATAVLGQESFTAGFQQGPATAKNMFVPTGIVAIGQKLWVSDSSYYRVTRFDLSLP